MDQLPEWLNGDRREKPEDARLVLRLGGSKPSLVLCSASVTSRNGRGRRQVIRSPRASSRERGSLAAGSPALILRGMNMSYDDEYEDDELEEDEAATDPGAPEIAELLKHFSGLSAESMQSIAKNCAQQIAAHLRSQAQNAMKELVQK